MNNTQRQVNITLNAQALGYKASFYNGNGVLFAVVRCGNEIIVEGDSEHVHSFMEIINDDNN